MDLPVVKLYNLTIIRLARLIPVLFARYIQRLVALFLVVVILLGASSQTVFAIAASTGPNASTVSNRASNAKNTHKTSTTPSIGKINYKSPPAPNLQKSNFNAAVGAKPIDQSGSGSTLNSNSTSILDKLTGKADNQVMGAVASSVPAITPHELVNKRNATTSYYLNKNGTITKTQYFSPHFYQNNGSWDTINTTLTPDDNAADSGNVVGKALGVVESWLTSSPTAFTDTENNWQARFTPSDFSLGMVRIKQGNQQVGFVPVNANSVNPVITTDSTGTQTVHYYNLWDGVDVNYMVQNEEVKEAIVLKSSDAASQVQFKMLGAGLQKPAANNSKQVQPAFDVTGVFNNNLYIAPANFIANNVGPEDNSITGLSQGYSNGILTVSVNSSYLKNLPSKDFPAVIDPNEYFGDRNGGNYESFESTGYNCPSNVCDLYAGGVTASNGSFQHWRGAFYVSYNQFQPGGGEKLNDASLHLYQRNGVNWWTGYTNSYTYQVGNATCLSGINCMDSYWDTGSIGTQGNIDVYNIYHNLITNNNWGGWIMVAGDGTALSWKAWDPDNTYITFTYDQNISPTTFATPQSNQVYTTTQPSFRVNYESNPNSTTVPLQYSMLITDGADGNGTVISSGNFQNSQDWTVPDGVLQDGSTYYIETQSYDPVSNSYSSWSNPIPFKIDLREGSDSTQTYDSLGPVNVDLATGNLETSASSHSTAALGGSIGVNLDYNSPLKSRPGLVGSYWTNGDGSASSPQLREVDQNVDFDWASGSPDSPTISSTEWSSEWDGYFVAPSTGSYTFGGTNDDYLTITANGQQLYSNGGCPYSTGPCFGSSISLTAGQVVPIKVAYSQVTGPDYVHMYVEGAVPEQIVPEAWLQTGVRQTQQTQGLTGKYYTYSDTGVPPTIGSSSNTLFLTRTDPLISFDWNSGSPVTNGPTDDFLAEWTGYFTAPTTGSYYFGTESDDGSKVTVSVSGTNNTVYNSWQDATNGMPSSPAFGTSVSLAAGQSYPITVDYYQHTGGDAMKFYVEAPNGTGGNLAAQIVPSDWLSPQAEVLPDGWDLGTNPDGSVSYNHLTVNQNNAILSDASGDTYDYVWQNNGYVPPANSYGSLVRNDDGTFTFQDSNGETYVFDASGNLTQVNNPIDDEHPAALQYSYGQINGTGPVALQQITDGVNANRYMKLYYSGATQCGTIPSTYYLAPTNMLCAAQTNDGRTTYFYYDQFGNLTEVSSPGNEDTTYQYQSVSDSDNNVIGYQLTGVRDPLANDAVVAGERADDTTTYTNIGYDVLGRVTNVQEPAATASASQFNTLIDYYIGSTEEHVSGATEPAGYTKKIEYDSLYRTTAVFDNQGLETTNVWDPVKDLLYSSTNPEGLMTTNVYDDQDRPVSNYGPAPASEFNTWNWTMPNDTTWAEGTSIWSPDHRFEFIFQTDGNVVLYGPNGAMWASNTGGQTATGLVMQTDGNLVEYNNGSPIWASNTAGDGSTTYLAVQNDGDAVLYNSSGPVWETDSSSNCNSNCNINWGSSPSSSTYGTPLSSYVNQIARTDTAYDQGLTGLGVAYMAVQEPGTNNASLVQAPLLHSTNIASDGTITHDWGSTPPVTTSNGDWGFSMTGVMRLPTTGSWQIQLTADEGMNMWIDGQNVINDWKDNPYWTGDTTDYSATKTDTYTFSNNFANQVHTIRIDYYHISASSDATFSLAMTPPSGSQTTQVASYFSPDYNLKTSSTAYDSTVGNTTTTTGYGSNPELGLNTTNTVDPSGLDLSTTKTYESPGSGYNRLTGETSAGGGTTTYSYYGANDTAANPCVSGSSAAYQAGMLKTETGPSPDNGTTSGKTITSVYDDAGNVVATEENQDGWECKTYDSRDRLTQDVVPAYNGNASRTTTYNYAVSGNPLVTSVTDSSGTITTTTDLLGRTVSYTDAYGDTTTTAYDNLGRESSETSPIGTKTFTYDNYNRLTDEQLNGIDLARSSYNAYGQLSNVAYPSAGILGTTIGYDPNTGNENSLTDQLTQATTGSNLVPNPLLEQTSSGQPTSWDQGNWGTNTANFSYVTNDGYGGTTDSAEINMTSYTSGDAKWYFNPVNITGNGTYNFSDYYKSNVSTTIEVQYTYADGSNSYQNLGTAAAASSWTQASYNFTAPATATQATVFHLINSVGTLQTTDFNMQQTGTPISVNDSVSLTQSGKVQNDVVTSGSNSLWYTYGYNAADELTSADIGPNTYAYSYGSQSSSCGTGSNMNANAGMNGNRTSQTINGTTTTYCYNYADQLVSSSDPSADADQYDSHGNLTQIGSGSAPLSLYYDASDRVWGMEQHDQNGNGNAMYYNEDALNRLDYREHDTISNWNWDMDAQYWYGYTDTGSSPSFVYNSSWQIIEEYVQLPGGAFVTIRPQRAGGAPYYTLPNVHGDTLLLADGSGTNISNGNGPSDAFTYDPFGNALPGGNLPEDTDYGSFGYEGSHEKFTETALTLDPMLMGARVYLPTIGRFTGQDPIGGGSPNTYAYPTDPINDSDLSGDCWKDFGWACSVGQAEADATGVWNSYPVQWGVHEAVNSGVSYASAGIAGAVIAGAPEDLPAMPVLATAEIFTISSGAAVQYGISQHLSTNATFRSRSYNSWLGSTAFTVGLNSAVGSYSGGKTLGSVAKGKVASTSAYQKVVSVAKAVVHAVSSFISGLF